MLIIIAKVFFTFTYLYSKIITLLSINVNAYTIMNGVAVIAPLPFSKSNTMPCFVISLSATLPANNKIKLSISKINVADSFNIYR